MSWEADYEKMGFFPWTILSFVIFTLAFQFGILQKCYRMFSSKQMRSNSTPTFLLFFCYLTVSSITAILYYIYTLVLWRSDEVLYNAQIMYFSGLIPWILIISNPIFQFGLCLERCFIVAFPYRYLHKWKRAMCIFVLEFSFIALSSNLIFNGFIWLPADAATECRYFSCVVSVLPQRYVSTYKIVISALELISAIVLFCLIKFKTLNMTSKGRKKNVVILVVILTTVLCEFTPNLIDAMFFNVCFFTNNYYFLHTYFVF